MSALTDQLAEQVEVLLTKIAGLVEDLSDEELHALPMPQGISIGSHAWHTTRTADNLARFAMRRAQPVWLEQGLDERWNLPRVNQGTGMTLEENQALRFPPGPELAGYALAVRDAIVPEIRAFDDEFLLEPMTTRDGEVERQRVRAEVLSAALLAHGNQHLGQIDLLRQMLGKAPSGV